MSYIVMSLNSLEGFQQGHFRRLDNLFLVDVDDRGKIEGKHAKWSEVMCEAKRFEAEEEALGYIVNVWGFMFASSTMVVVSVTDQALMSNAEKKNKIQDHNYMRRVPA